MKEKLKRKGILRPLLKQYALRYLVGVVTLPRFLHNVFRD